MMRVKGPDVEVPFAALRGRNRSFDASQVKFYDVDSRMAKNKAFLNGFGCHPEGVFSRFLAFGLPIMKGLNSGSS